VTGQEKAGEAGVKRQYMGCADRVANGINTDHLSYVRARTGHALIGARQWIPQEHIEDPVKSLVMGLPYQGRGQGPRHPPGLGNSSRITAKVESNVEIGQYLGSVALMHDRDRTNHVQTFCLRH